LTALTLPPKAKDIEFLRKLPKLQRVSYQETPNNVELPTKTATEFWKEFDVKKK